MIAGVVTRSLVALIAKQVADHHLVVWYDPERVGGGNEWDEGNESEGGTSRTGRWNEWDRLERVGLEECDRNEWERTSEERVGQAAR
jgi:hypothetical protein